MMHNFDMIMVYIDINTIIGLQYKMEKGTMYKSSAHVGRSSDN